MLTKIKDRDHQPKRSVWRSTTLFYFRNLVVKSNSNRICLDFEPKSMQAIFKALIVSNIKRVEQDTFKQTNNLELVSRFTLF